MFQFLVDHTDIATALAAIASVLVAAVALMVSLGALFIQQRHNRLSVRPIPDIHLDDYLSQVGVRLRNSGAGPLVIKEIRITDGKTYFSKLVDAIPRLPNDRVWNDFSSDLTHRALFPGKDEVLIDLRRRDNEPADDFSIARISARSGLSNLTVIVSYTDIYGSRLTNYQRRLDWFSR